MQGEVYARGNTYTCRVEVAPGSEPNNGRTTDIPPGDFQQVSSSWCDGSNHTSSFNGVAREPRPHRPQGSLPGGGRERSTVPSRCPAAPNFNNRPNHEPFGFIVRVVVTSVQGSGRR